MSETPVLRVVPVVLCGGSGTRLWPLSRQNLPKQLLKLGDHSLLQESVLRVHGDEFTAPILICAEQFEHLVRDQMAEIGITPRALIVEPMGRNTAPAVAMAALTLSEAADPALMLVLPSDHFIRDADAFRDAFRAGTPAAAAGMLVTFGITPSSPHTGYGYIHGGDAVATMPGVHAVRRFVEKPNLKDAQAYLLSREYYWNGGIFLFSPQAVLRELNAFRPAMLESCQAAMAAAVRQGARIGLPPAAFEAVESDSIDYAIMEHTRQAAVVPVSMGWSDIGSWAALWEQSDKDENANAIKGDVLAIDSRNCYLHSEKRLLVGLGVEDLVVVAAADAILVAHKDHCERVKDVVARLKLEDRAEATNHAMTFRPWGNFQSIDRGDRFHVKHIVVNPGGQLSLQKHWHRSEHWIVVQGTAMVTCGDHVFCLRENESTFIPAGTVHRLENPGRLPLRLIEVQSGAYLGEDDIVRLSDSYGRTDT